MRRWLLAFLLLLLAPPVMAGAPRQALVLGAAQYNGSPSPAFTRRLQAALRLYRSGRVTRIVVSGGAKPGDHYTEGGAGCHYLLKQGVPKSSLACETKSRSTWENLLFSKPLLGGEPVWLVTDAPHLPRALLLAQRLGIAARGWPVEGNYSESYRLREKLLLALARLGIYQAP